jgi:deoxyribodipyrimidine photolyase-related protein
MDDVEHFFKGRKGYFQTEFYIWQRKQQNILLENDGKPVGGKWSFDAENRNRFPKGEFVPAMPWVKTTAVIKKSSDYVNRNFGENPGSTDNFGYPCTFEEADRWLDTFIKERLEKFGTYEDAMVEQENFLYHSILTPMLNTGLLTPREIIGKVLEHGDKHHTPLNAVEGFVRQVMGWREFIRIVYEREGRKQRTTNHFNFTRSLPYSFWTGTTGIAPVDQVIRHTLDHSYTHHINRLMVLGNFMLLCEFNPHDVYRWFMEMYIDAYDWVMVPNVYGMSQYADGGMMTTKPYISGSNYLIKMGNWQKGDWQVVWDGLFWRFMDKHRTLFTRNPRMGMLLNTFDKMDPKRKNTLLANAEAFLLALPV